MVPCVPGAAGCYASRRLLRDCSRQQLGKVRTGHTHCSLVLDLCNAYALLYAHGTASREPGILLGFCLAYLWCWKRMWHMLIVYKRP